jgi:hypothetical protein
MFAFSQNRKGTSVNVQRPSMFQVSPLCSHGDIRRQARSQDQERLGDRETEGWENMLAQKPASTASLIGARRMRGSTVHY